ncbi:MAG: electron transport complex subunit E [Clostridiales bacterium]|nr:electron transport complex subunit E [Clostridiales bacterium]
MNPYLERIYNGIVKENPCLVLMLGMCPTLAVTTSAINGLGMGVSTMIVLIFSNLIISAMRNVIPDQVRLPAYIVITASLVTIVDLLMQAYTPGLYDSLGIYIPLIVVNCIILGRAEAYANRHTPDLAAFDGIGMGLGFTIALTVIGLLREFFGAGTVFNITVIPDSIPPVAIFVKAPGAFLVIAFIIAIMNAVHIHTEANKKVEGCDGCCATCQISHGSSAAADDTDKITKEEATKA